MAIASEQLKIRPYYVLIQCKYYMIAIRSDHSTKVNTLSKNQETYQRLKQALTLGLRRQIFMVVCENINLRDRYLSSLDQEIYPSLRSEATQSNYASLFVTIHLNLESPNFWVQISQWFKQNHGHLIPDQKIYFQIIGIEKLTRQTPIIQRQFLKSLTLIQRYIHELDFNLLLWVSRPWLNYIEKTVPSFWCWHTGIFEFEGEPTPLTSGISQPESSNHFDNAYFGFNQDQVNFNYQTNLSQNLQNIPSIPVYDDEDIEINDELISDLVVYDESGDLLTQNQLNEMEEDEQLSSQNESQDIVDHEQETDIEQIESLAELTKLTTENEEIELTDQVVLNQQEVEKEESPTNKLNNQEHQPTLLLSTIEDLEELSKLNYPKEVIATACFQLAYQYRDRIAEGEVTKDNLKIAIQAYQHGLQNLPEDDQNLPNLLNDLGNLYWMLSRQTQINEEMTALLKIAIQSYQLALLKINTLQITSHQNYAMIHNNLGAVYSDLARFTDPENNLQLSIQSYEEALKYRTEEDDPFKYGSTQNNLGTAYWHLSQLTKSIPNLKEAIYAYQEALNQYDPQFHPLNWAMIQNNIGTAYWNLSQYENPEKYLNCAINSYHLALKYRTPEIAPVAYAATQNNLGTAYWHLSEQYQQDYSTWYNYLTQAITAYEIAIYFVDLLGQKDPPIPVNFEYLVTLSNLGLVHYQIATHSYLDLNLIEKSHHLDQSLITYVKVLAQEQVNSENYQTAFNAIIKTIRAKFEQEGITGQNEALAKIPSELLPKILPRL